MHDDPRMFYCFGFAMFAFPLQKWLRERTTALRLTYKAGIDILGSGDLRYFIPGYSEPRSGVSQTRDSQGLRPNTVELQ